MISSTSLFNQRIDCLTLEQVYKLAIKTICKQRKILLFPINVNILLKLKNDQQTKKDYEKAGIIFADGVPLVKLSTISFFCKQKLPGRVSGTELTEKFLLTSQSSHFQEFPQTLSQLPQKLPSPSLKIFLFGSNKEVLKIIAKKYPAKIVGQVCPTADELLSESYNKKVVSLINKSGAQIIFVALGPLKQEKWLLEHYAALNTNVGFVVGSALDILSGNFVRAPKIMQELGCEWFWRIVLEPKRLAKRYFRDSLSFFKLIVVFSFKKIGSKIINKK